MMLELAPFSAEILVFLFLIAIVAGFLDTLAGGGGLLTLPALILAGAPPLAALGTNKFQSTIGTATAALMMVKKGKVAPARIRPLMLTAFVGSALGSVAVQFIDSAALSVLIPVVLAGIALYFLISPAPATGRRAPGLSAGPYKNALTPAIGFYDGMFGPGTGSLYALAGVLGRGQTLIEATAAAKPLNFATNLASLLVFLAAGQVIWQAGLGMLLGQLIGAWLGAHCLFRINPAWLRVIIVLVCGGMLLRYCLAP